MTKRKKNIRTLLDFNTSSGLKEWKFAISKRIWDFVKTNFPSKERVTGYDFWVDSDTLVNGLILTGYAIPAARMRGFSAPVDNRAITRRHVFKGDMGWRITNNRAMTGALGVWQRPTEYYGGRTLEGSLGFFAVTQENEVRAFGLDDEGALPVYSYDVCTWLDEQSSEVQRILDETFLELFGTERKSA